MKNGFWIVPVWPIVLRCSMVQSLVSVREVSRRFVLGNKTVHALRSVDLDLYPREVVLIEGKSGSGKTTLLNLMGGLDNPSEGEVRFRERSLASYTRRALAEWRRAKIGFVFQSFALIEGLTAYENVDTAARIGGLKPSAAERRSNEMLGRVGLTNRASHRISELSGGEQQRVALARGLVCDREVVFADEPTGELDHATSRWVLDFIREIVEERKTTICLTSHDPAVIGFADRVYRLDDGSLVENHNGSKD